MALMNAQSQEDQPLVLADKYFSSGDYLTAAGLYEQYLHPVIKETAFEGFPLNVKKNRTGRATDQLTKPDILYKQAESYRLANYFSEAAERYMTCFETDAHKYEAALYWYAVCQRSLGNYTMAVNSLNSFFKSYTAGSPYYQVAQEEMERLLFIQKQTNRPDTVMYHVEKIMGSAGNQSGIYALVSNGGNQFFLTGNDTIAAAVATQNPPFNIKSIFPINIKSIFSIKRKTVAAPFTNPNYNRLFNAGLNAGSLQNIDRVNIENLDTLSNQAAASVSADGNRLYFTQWKNVEGKIHSAIYYSTKKENAWSSPVLLTAVNLEGYNSKQPFCSADGKYLYFTSDRPGGLGQFDIWYAPLQSDGTCGEPVNTGAMINTKANEVAPFYHNESGTLVFASDGRQGMGGLDLFASKGTVTEWNAPENMGYPVNSSRDDIYFFAPEKAPLLNNALFSSDRGASCCMETYSVKKTVKKKMVAGLIVDCRNNQPIADAEILLQDGMGNKKQLRSNNDGTFLYELTSDPNGQQLAVNKEKYTDKAANLQIERINGSNWQTDTLYTTPVCMEEKLVIKVENVVSIYFDFDESKIKEEGRAKLDSIYTELMVDTTINIQISGYTDGRGSEEYNKILSDKRAKACADYLIEKGISETRMRFESFGACCPVEMELIDGRDNPDGRSRNRRAMINIDRH